MASTGKADTIPADDSGKSSFELYREGKATDIIRFTMHLVLSSRRWRALLDEKLRPIEQSAARMEAMAAIINSPALSPQVDIARRLRIEGPTLTRMLDSLERDELVKRLPDPNDRRTNQLKLTDKGEATLEEIFAIADIYRGRLMEGFSPEEVATLNRFFAILLERLDAGLLDPDAPPQG